MTTSKFKWYHTIGQNPLLLYGFAQELRLNHFNLPLHSVVLCKLNLLIHNDAQDLCQKNSVPNCQFPADDNVNNYL